MTSNWDMKKSLVSDSQNFVLRLSESSTDDVDDNNIETDDVIVISDSDSSLSNHLNKSEDLSDTSNKIILTSSNERINTPKNNEKAEEEKSERQIYMLRTSSSDSEDRDFNPPWNRIDRLDNKSLNKKYVNRNIVQVNEILYTSDETHSTDAIQDDNGKDQRNKSDIPNLYKTAALKFIQQARKANMDAGEEQDNVKQTNKMKISNCTPHDHECNIHTELNKVSVNNSPVQQNRTGKVKLTKEDALRIFRNIKSTRIIYNSPRERKNTNIIIQDSDVNADEDIMHPALSPKIINESTEIDTDEDVIHPALSPKSTKEIKGHNNSPNVIYASSQDNIIPNSQTVLSKLRTNRPLSSPQKEVCHKLLSKNKKQQILEWLMTNISESLDDSSCSNISPSAKNGVSSGNSSLERLEANYETPNNRGKIAKTRTDKKHNPNVDCDKVARSPLIDQIITDRSIPKHKDNNCEFPTLNRPKYLSPTQQSEKIVSPSSVTNTPKNTDIMDCADILDKLYGKSWRDRADSLLPATELRKKSDDTKYRIIETERKPTSKDKHLIKTDWRTKGNILSSLTKPHKGSVRTKHKTIETDRKFVSKDKQYITKPNQRDKPDTEHRNTEEEWTHTLKTKRVTNLNLNKPHSERKIQRKQKKQFDDFINDESLTSSDSESMYHTALTNPGAFNSTVAKTKPVSTLTARIRALCDSHSENEDCESSDDSKKNLRRRLSFNDDKSSSTSEFDPGDHISPKHIPRKKPVVKQQSQIPKYQFMDKFVMQKSFLASLSNTVPISNAHQDAIKYRSDYRNNKEELCTVLFKLFNEKVFNNKLPSDTLIEWSVRMRGTAGYCYNKKSVKNRDLIKSSRIVLATKVLDAPDRLRDTLIHEMCHSAAWIINNVCDGHGSFWRAWANKAMRTFPELPPIHRCHDYKIKTKFTYRCTRCGYSIGRHSKSLDIERKRCGHCYGKFELLINKTTKSGVVQMHTSKKEPSGFALYVKQNYNLVKKERNIKHADVMKILGQQFAAIKITNKNDLDIENESISSN